MVVTFFFVPATHIPEHVGPDMSCAAVQIGWLRHEENASIDDCLSKENLITPYFFLLNNMTASYSSVLF